MRLPLSLLVLVGGLYLLLSWAGKAWRESRAGKNSDPPGFQEPQSSEAVSGDDKHLPGRQGERQALAYLYALLVPTLLLLLFVVDPSWKSPRYGLMLLPHFFLIASVFLCRLGRWLWGFVAHRRSVRQEAIWTWIAVTIVVILIAVGSWPSARAATRESVPSYDWAFSYVQEHLQPGDEVITFLCPAAFFHLGRCDYLAVPVDFSGFAIERGGRWVSGWDEVPILDGAENLNSALASDSRAWFVVDEGRFLGRYDDGEMIVRLAKGEQASLIHERLRRAVVKHGPIGAAFKQTARFLDRILPRDCYIAVEILEGGE